MEKRLLLLVVVAILAFAGVAKGEEVVITGYPVGEFAVKGDVESQLNKLVAEIRTKQLTDHELQINVVGSADSTGISAANDRLARDRAEQVAAVLAANFPKAKINTWSKGDADNVRQVKVEWNFVPIPKPAPAPASAVTPPNEKSNLIFWVIAVVILVVIVIIFFRTATRRLEKKTVAEKDKVKWRWVEGKIDGKNYSVPIEIYDGKFSSPFKTLEDPTKNLFRLDFQNIKKAVRGCMTDDRYGKQREELIKKEVIKIS